MGNRKRVAWVLLGLLVSACSPAAKLPGSYIAKADGGGLMVQINSAKDGAVAGTLTGVTPAGNGDVNAATRMMSGTLDGKALNLSLENGNGVSVVTGTVVPDGLDLTVFFNGSSEKLHFVRSKAEDFAKIETAVRSQAAQTRQATLQSALVQAQAKGMIDQQARIDRAVHILQTKLQGLSDAVNGVSLYPQVLHAAVARATMLKNRAATIAPNGGQGDVAIAQIGVARQQNAVQLDDAQTGLRNHVSQFDRTYQADMDAIRTLQASCGGNTRLNCAALSESASLYAQRAQAFRSLVGQEETQYEHAHQNL